MTLGTGRILRSPVSGPERGNFSFAEGVDTVGTILKVRAVFQKLPERYIGFGDVMKTNSL
ncbi:MAG: hypothetical protein M0T73_04820 [Deltaproteobacteria bacterium]|nr:hypothetical protein [Deltaproteobacteria bacterium]